MTMTQLGTSAQSSPILSYADHAKFATTARLVSCLIAESLLDAVFVPLSSSEISPGAAVVFLKGVPKGEDCSREDVFVVIPLHHLPVFKNADKTVYGRLIAHADPADMLPIAYTIRACLSDVHFDAAGSELLEILRSNPWSFSDESSLVLCRDPLILWEQFSRSLDMDVNLAHDIAEELESSSTWQAYSYEHPPKRVAFESPSIGWEQSIVEGHPMHPVRISLSPSSLGTFHDVLSCQMHKARRTLPPMPHLGPGSYDLYTPKLRFVAMPSSALNVTGDWIEHISPVIRAAEKAAGSPLGVPEDHIVLPIHELQVPNIEDKFQEAIVLDAKYTVSALAQQSIRSLILPGALRLTSLKLGVGIKLTSAVRTISPPSAYFGPRFSARFPQLLTYDRDILTVTRELASVVSNKEDGEVAKHCAAIVREAFEEVYEEEKGERLIVCSALSEKDHAPANGVDQAGCELPAVITAFGLYSQESRIQWLDEFVELYFKAFLPPILKNGCAFEAHPQNTLARFDMRTKKLVGFVIRDFGGMKIHPATLKETTGEELDAIEGHSIISKTLEDVYARFWHTAIFNLLQQLIRALDLHHSGKGWEIVRKHLVTLIPADHPMYDAWLGANSATVPGKCFMRMRIAGMYRFHLHGPFPNLIHYNGVDA